MLTLQIIVGVAVGITIGGLLLHTILTGQPYLYRCLELISIGLGMLFIGLPFMVLWFQIFGDWGWSLCSTASVSYSAIAVFFGWGTIMTALQKDIPYLVCFFTLMLISACISFALFSPYCTALTTPYVSFTVTFLELFRDFWKELIS